MPYLEIHFPYNRSDKIQVRLFYFFGQNDGLDCKYVRQTTQTRSILGIEEGSNLFSFSFQTPLHKAAAVGNTDLVRLLISASVQVTYQGVLSTCRVQLDLLVRSVRWT